MKFSKELKVGLVGFLTLLAFYFGYNFLNGKNVFRKGSVYNVVYDNVSGLAPSSGVLMNGLKIGRVNDISFLENGSNQLLVEIQLEKDLALSDGTRFEIFSDGLMGSKQVRIIPSYKGASIEKGDTLVGFVGVDLVQSFSNQAVPVKEKLEKTLGGLDQTASSFKNTSDGLDEVIELNGQELNALIKDLRSLSSNIGQMIASTDVTMKEYQKVATKLNNLSIEESVSNLNKASVELKNLMYTINTEQGTAGKLLHDKSLYENLNKTSINLQNLLEDLEQNPSKYVQISVFGKREKQED